MSALTEQINRLVYGAQEVIEISELTERIQSKGTLRVKFGADPTASDLHLGHTVVLRKLRVFQEFGHRVIFIIGDFTARIGDPTGRTQTRPPLSKEEVMENARTYQEQVFKILIPERTEVVFNSDWLENMKLEDVIKLSSLYTVARMLERDDFNNRYQQGFPIHIHEFLYPLLQAYDSVVVKADVELGGTDQKFNLLVGRDIQRAFNQPPQVVITMPLLEGTDGVQKMSKSYGNYIGINEPPSEMFGKIMSIPDSLIPKYFKLVTDLSPSEIEVYLKQLSEGRNPRDVKMDLAYIIVKMYHGVAEAEHAREEFERIFSKREFPEDAPVFNLTFGKTLLDVLRDVMSFSSSEAKRLIRQGAVKVNGEKILDPLFAFKKPGEYFVKIGKRRFVKLKVSGLDGEK